MAWKQNSKTAPFDKREGMRHPKSFQTCLPPARRDPAPKVVSSLFATSLGNGASVFSGWAGNHILLG